MSLRICVLLWPRSGRDTELHNYEDAVLPLLADHGGTLAARERVVRTSDADPAEPQLIELADQHAFDSYLRDPRRIALEDSRSAAIARTQILNLA